MRFTKESAHMKNKQFGSATHAPFDFVGGFSINLFEGLCQVLAMLVFEALASAKALSHVSVLFVILPSDGPPAASTPSSQIRVLPFLLYPVLFAQTKRWP